MGFYYWVSVWFYSQLLSKSHLTQLLFFHSQVDTVLTLEPQGRELNKRGIRHRNLLNQVIPHAMSLL